MTGLKLSPDLTLPLDAATGTYGILATKGAGKSNAAKVMAEGMYDAGVPWVAIDPKGDWWGVRSSADGEGPGLAVPVIGGRHGDVPLDAHEGAGWADAVLDHGMTCVLDVSQFTKGETVRFLHAFGQRLFRQAEDQPMHLFLEEAHEYLPQRVDSSQAEMVGTWQRIVKQGRFKGLGCTLISQRSSVLNKDVLELVDTLIVLRTMGPLSRKSIEKWVEDQDVDAALLKSLPSLKDGEAWIWSPGALGIMQKIRFLRCRTFDSGATPKVGERRVQPKAAADVDLEAIKEQMAESIEKAKADDPRELRKQLKTATDEIARLIKLGIETPPEPLVETVTITVKEPYVPDGVTKKLADVRNRLTDLSGEVADAVQLLLEADLAEPVREESRSYPVVNPTALKKPMFQDHPADPASYLPPPKPVRRTAETEADPRLGKAERAVLGVLTQYPDGRTPSQVCLLTGYSPKASTLSVVLSKLRKLGYVEPNTVGGRIVATEEGLALGLAPLLPSGPELYDYWLGQLKGREKLVLNCLVDAWPDSLTHTDLCLMTDTSESASTMSVIMSKLRKLELAKGWAASDDFMQSIGR